ncbi:MULTISPECIES: hypothetical protein [unclassified Bradyrhizobium]
MFVVNDNGIIREALLPVLWIGALKLPALAISQAVPAPQTGTPISFAL